MPDFLPPTIVGPISTESKTVAVENHQAGTTLKILANGASVVGTKPGCAGGRDTVNFTRSLTVGESLTATQEDPGGPPSAPSADPVIVQAVPNPPPQARFDGTVYRCVEFLRLSGLVPGAKFEIHQPTGTVIGHGDSPDGTALVRTTTPTSPSAPLVARHITSTGTADAQYPVELPPVPQEVPRQLGKLAIAEAKDCGWYVDIDGTVSGVEAKITRGRGAALDLFGVGWDGHTRFWVADPFQAGDTIEAEQHLPAQCEIRASIPSPKYDVQQRPLDPPTISEPVCADARTLDLTGIEPGADFAVSALIPVTAGGDKRQRIGRGTFPKQEPFHPIHINPVKPEPDQVPGSRPRLVIDQTACGVASHDSAAAEMQALPATPLQPKFLDPLFACAVFVRVGNVPPGAWVSVHSQRSGGRLPADPQGGRLGRAHASGGEVSVWLDQSLVEGDVVWALTESCQGAALPSGPQTVASSSALRGHIDEPVYPTDTTIFVRQLATGARVVVQVDGPGQPGNRKLLTSFAWGPAIPVYVGSLFEHDQITVLQNLCARFAGENQSNTVPVELGQLDAEAIPHAVNRGAYTDFIVTAKDPKRGNAPVAGDVLFNGAKVAATNATFWWTPPTSGATISVAVNAPGYKSWAGTITLTTPPPPPPPPPPHSPPPPPHAAQPSYTYSCKINPNNIVITVQGSGFPTGKEIFIEPGLLGIFTAFGVTHLCGELYPAPQTFGGNYAKSDGTFKVDVTIPVACAGGCAVTVNVECTGVASSSISRPAAGSGCQCPGP